MRLENLIEQRNAVARRAEQLLNDSESDGFDWTSEHDEQVAGFRSEIDDLDTRINTRISLREAAQEQQYDAALNDAQDAASRKVAHRTFEDQEKVLRAKKGANLNVDLTSARSWMLAREAGVAPDELLRAASRGERYEVHEGEVITRTLNVGTASAGGNLVPTILASTLYKQLYAYPGVRRAGARVFMTPTGAAYEIPTSGADPTVNSVSVTPESGAISETPRTFGKVEFGAHKFTSRLDLTDEFIADTMLNLSGYLGVELGRHLAHQEEYAFHTGSGTGEPQGYGLIGNHRTGNSDNSTVIRTANDDLATQAEVLGMVRELDEDYTINVKWLGRRASFLKLIEAKGTDGHYLVPDVYQMAPARRLRGYVWVMDRFSTDMIDGTDASSTDNTNTQVCSLADWNRFYAIREVGSMQIRYNPYIRQANGEVVYFAQRRCDGRLFDRRAGKVLFTSATAS
ncbi:MAG: phage major capsid protein [Proteobacteria bacterium]|nr:phage major capsid protein [Pseudomonadota bacterium]